MPITHQFDQLVALDSFISSFFKSFFYQFFLSFFFIWLCDLCACLQAFGSWIHHCAKSQFCRWNGARSKAEESQPFGNTATWQNLVNQSALQHYKPLNGSLWLLSESQNPSRLHVEHQTKLDLITSRLEPIELNNHDLPIEINPA